MTKAQDPDQSEDDFPELPPQPELEEREPLDDPSVAFPDVLRLSARDSERVADMLLHPPAPNVRLCAAARSVAASQRRRRRRAPLPLWRQALQRHRETC